MELWRVTGARLRAGLRHRWVGALLLPAVLVTVVVGGVLGVALGARRNATAFDRMVRAGGGPDLLVTPGQGYLTAPADAMRRIRAVPRVTAVSAIAEFAAAPTAHTDDPGAMWTFQMEGATDDAALTRLMRPVVVAGRLADSRRADEVIVNVDLAEHYHVTPGDRFGIRQFLSADDDRGVVRSFTVVGVVRFPDEIVEAPNGRQAVLMTTPAFVAAHRTAVPASLYAVNVVDPGRDTAAVTRAITAAFGGNRPGFATIQRRRSVFDLSAGPVTSSLVVFATLFGVLGLVLTGQTLRRLQLPRRDVLRVLEGLGASRRTRLAVAAALPVPGIALGLLGAAVLATVVAARFPVGVARRAEPHPGFALNVAWTAAGLTVAVVLLALLTAAVSWVVLVAPREATPRTGRSRFVRTLAGLGLPVAVTEGWRHALERSPGRDSTRRGMPGVGLGMVGVVAALVFAANVHALATSPDRYGWTWHELVELDVSAGSDALHVQMRRIAASPGVEAVSAFSPVPLMIDGVRVPTVAVDPGDRPVPVTMARGAVPTGVAQVAVGATVLRRLGLRTGDVVTVATTDGARHVRARVTGEVVLPSVGVELMADLTDLGDSAAVPFDLLRRLQRVAQVGVAVRFAPGATAAQRRAAIASFAPLVARGEALVVDGPQQPNAVVGLGEIGGLPTLLAGALLVLTTLDFSLVLVSAGRSRRRDVAVLRTIGAVRRQVVTMTLWEVVATAGGAAVIGAVGGVALGRGAWNVLADRLGVAPVVVTPVATVVVVVVAVTVTAAVLAAVTTSLTARSSPAPLLGGE